MNRAARPAVGVSTEVCPCLRTSDCPEAPRRRQRPAAAARELLWRPRVGGVQFALWGQFSQCLVFGGAAPMLGARSRLVRGVLAQLSPLFGATVLCHGVLNRKSLVRDLFRLVSYRPLAGKPLIRLDLLHRCWPGHIAEDVPLAIAEAVLAAMGRRRAPCSVAAARAALLYSKGRSSTDARSKYGSRKWRPST